MSNARRVTIYHDRKGQYRYRVQSGNWATVGASEEGFKQKRTILKRIAKLYPGVEVVDQT